MIFGNSKRIKHLEENLDYEAEKLRKLRDDLNKSEAKFDLLLKHLNVTYEEKQIKAFTAVAPTSPPTAPSPANP